MNTNKKIALVIILTTAVAAAIGLMTGFVTITTGVGIAVCGIVIGTGVARGAFSRTPKGTK